MSSLRIALIHARHADVGGAETWLNQLCQALGNDGHEPTIVCRRHGASPHPAARFETLRVRAPGNAARLWAFARAAERHVERNSYDLVVSLGRTWCHDVIRCGGAMRKTYLALQRQFFYGPWERALGKGALKGSVAMALEKRMFGAGNFRRVIANSELLKRDIVDVHGVDPQQISVIPNGVDLERFHPERHRAAATSLRREWGIDDDDNLLLFMGVGFARKGLGPLLEALPSVHERDPNTRLVIVGSDRHASRWQRDAEALRLPAGIVQFVGRRGDPEICFAAADLHVLPTWYDSFAYTVLESLAAGVPVVTTANAGASELITTAGGHGESPYGAVLPSRYTAPELAEALVAWGDRERRVAAVNAARACAEEHSVERCMARVVTLLEEVAADRATS